MSHVCAFCFCTSFQDILHQFILTSQCYITKVIQANSKKGHKTNYKTNINKHIKTIHKKDMPFICDHCPKRFSSKGTLEQHIKNTCGVEINALASRLQFPTIFTMTTTKPIF